MARKEQDREDLLAEATAFVERVEFSLPGFDKPVFVGFRRDGCASVYFGQDPVYQFNTRNQLRRAYRGGVRYKSERGKLVALDVRRGDDRVTMQSAELDSHTTEASLAEMQSLLSRLREQLAGEYAINGQVPDDVDLVDRCCRWLDALPQPVEVAASPHAR